MSSSEEAPPYIHCSPLPSGDPFPSRFQHLTTWVREHYRELQVRADDDRPADFNGMYTLRVHTKKKPFVCELDGCNKAFSSSSNL
ncbi:hypothetical protein, partial [Sansalvadorimonas verongulae]|uniref:hypothetical protein n=1 Tax=Sansalvadorimonas verongulae TaxID=2172824 RepID=UPI001E3852E3